MNKYFVIKKNYKDENELRLFWNVAGVQYSCSVILNDADFEKLDKFDDDMYLKDKEILKDGK